MKTPAFNQHLKSLQQSLVRLEKSDSRLKRKNARQAVRSSLSSILKEMERQFPVIDKQGRERKRRSGPVCPVCGVPQVNFTALAKHLATKCVPQNAWQCPCGWQPVALRNSGWTLGKVSAAIGSHLAGQKDYIAHVREAYTVLQLQKVATGGSP